jgi:putative FmdB family regulatory protein
MRIFDYKCKECGTVEEVIFLSSETPDEKLLTACPNCGKVEMEKVFSFQTAHIWHEVPGQR